MDIGQPSTEVVGREKAVAITALFAHKEVFVAQGRPASSAATLGILGALTFFASLPRFSGGAL